MYVYAVPADLSRRSAWAKEEVLLFREGWVVNTETMECGDLAPLCVASLGSRIVCSRGCTEKSCVEPPHSIWEQINRSESFYAAKEQNGSAYSFAVITSFS